MEVFPSLRKFISSFLEIFSDCVFAAAAAAAAAAGNPLKSAALMKPG